MEDIKQCSCKSTSSGPRVIAYPDDEDRVVDGFVNSFKLVKMACDKCDKPWSWHPTKASLKKSKKERL